MWRGGVDEDLERRRWRGGAKEAQQAQLVDRRSEPAAASVDL